MNNKFHNLREQVSRINFLSNYKEGSLLMESMSETDMVNIGRIGIDGSIGSNKGEMMIDDKPITARDGSITVTGIKAEGKVIKIYATVTLLGRDVPSTREMGTFVQRGNGFDFIQQTKQQKNTYKDFREKASREDKAIFDSFVKGIRENSNFAQAVLAAVQGTENVPGSSWEQYFEMEIVTPTDQSEIESTTTDEKAEEEVTHTKEEENRKKEELENAKKAEEIAKQEADAAEATQKIQKEKEAKLAEEERIRKEKEAKLAEEERIKAERKVTKGKVEKENMWAREYPDFYGKEYK